MTTPAQHAAALAAAIAAFSAGTTNQTQLAAALTTALDAYDDVGGLQDAIKSLIASNETFLASVKFFQPSGAVDEVDELPVGRPTGEYWIITDGPFEGHGFLRAGGQWVDMGLVRGPTGLTPVLSVADVVALEPDAAPSATFSGTPEEPQLHLEIPRGRNALHGISLSAPYRMEANEILATYVSVDDERFNPSTALALSTEAADATYVLTIKRGDGSTWGTVTWSAGQTAGVFSIADPNNPAGGLLIFQGPPQAGCNLTNLALHLPGAAS